MSDPVAEAVHRSIAPGARLQERQAATDAAREALRPIREWIENPDAPWSDIFPLLYRDGELR